MKFRLKLEEYRSLMPCSIDRVRRIAIMGWSREAARKLAASKDDIEVTSIPEFVARVASDMKGRNVRNEGFLSELAYPLLHTVQYFFWALEKGSMQYALEELLARVTQVNRHGETDWGAPTGKEVW